MSTDAYERLEVESLATRALGQIRRQILEGAVLPGETLKDSVIADRMGISRSPVREALRMLEQSGLVEKDAHRSYRVALLAETDIPELAAMRVADETIAVRVIVEQRRSVGDLRELARRMRGISDRAELAELDAEFHMTVVRGAGMPRLAARYAALRDQITVTLSTGELPGIPSEHFADQHAHLADALEEAVSRGDAADVVRQWESHILAGMSAQDLFGSRAPRADGPTRT